MSRKIDSSKRGREGLYRVSGHGRTTFSPNEKARINRALPLNPGSFHIHLSFGVRSHRLLMGIVILILVLAGGGGLVIGCFHSFGLILALNFLFHFAYLYFSVIGLAFSLVVLARP